MNRLHKFTFIADKYLEDNYPSAVLSARDGIIDAVSASGMTPAMYAKPKSEGKVLSDIIEYHRLNNGQIDVNKLYTTLISNNFSDPENPRFLLISGDLRPPGLNFIYGFGVKEHGLAVQSIYRFLNIQKDLRSQASRHISRHEYGHLLGLDEYSIINQDSRGGIFRGHCGNVCTMRQAASDHELMELTTKLRYKKLAGFCLQCAGVLQSMHRV